MSPTRYTTDMLGLRESTLHRDLKSYYAYVHDGVIEQTVCGYRIDVLSGTQVYEIQTKEFYKIRPKIAKLMDEGYAVRVIYPIQGMLETKLPLGGVRRRKKKASPVKAFSELVYIAKLLPREELTIEILKLHERATKSKARRNRVRNTRLVAILDRWLIQSPWDLLDLLPDLPVRFTTKDLVEANGLSKLLATRVAYTLHHSGISQKIGHRDRCVLYQLLPRI